MGKRGECCFHIHSELSHLELGLDHQGMKEGIMLVECLHLVVHLVVALLLVVKFVFLTGWDTILYLFQTLPLRFVLVEDLVVGKVWHHLLQEPKV